jgi:hypothetical protein
MGLGYPAQAKLGLGDIVLVGVGALAFGWFVFRRVRRRRASHVPG